MRGPRAPDALISAPTPRRIPVPVDAKCGACRREVKLNAAECADGVFDCPHCHARVAAFLPAVLGCPQCKNRLMLSAAEQASGAFTCDRCFAAFITRAPETQALIPHGSAALLAIDEAKDKRLRVTSSVLSWCGLGLVVVLGVTLGGVWAVLGVAVALAGVIVGQLPRAGQRAKE